MLKNLKYCFYRGKHLFDEVIGSNGLLKSKTRILVTHSISFLAKTETIIVLENGEISEAGSYRELLQAKQAFADFLRQHLEDEGDEDDADPETAAVKQEILGTIGIHPGVTDRSPSITSSGSMRKVKNLMARQESTVSRRTLNRGTSKQISVDKPLVSNKETNGDAVGPKKDIPEGTHMH